MITLYGIPNCDTVKKARQWLDQHALTYQFHNYKKDGIDADTLRHWCQDFSLDELINRRGTTWRQLDPAQKDKLDQDSAIALMIENPSLIKRPLLDDGRRKLLGFSPEQYESLL